MKTHSILAISSMSERHTLSLQHFHEAIARDMQISVEERAIRMAEGMSKLTEEWKKVEDKVFHTIVTMPKYVEFTGLERFVNDPLSSEDLKDISSQHTAHKTKSRSYRDVSAKRHRRKRGLPKP